MKEFTVGFEITSEGKVVREEHIVKSRSWDAALRWAISKLELLRRVHAKVALVSVAFPSEVA
tara:strand:- start:272 stop:457 length:186 start_codon:yes stop_codon:yes gene_type:complete